MPMSKFIKKFIYTLVLFLSTNATMATEEVKFDIVHKNEVNP